MSVCDAPPPDHVHEYAANPRSAPVVGGGHTVFYSLVCECGRVEVFPDGNFSLTTPEYQAAFHEALARAGGFLVRAERPS